MFILPIILFELYKAVLISIAVGIYCIIANSLYLARQQEIQALPVISEHVILTIGVVVCSSLHWYLYFNDFNLIYL